MRRDINSRKRNKIKFNNLNKKTLIVISILLITIIIIVFFLILTIFKHISASNFEKYFSELSFQNTESDFSLNKISVISSATAETSIKNVSFINLNISQFSDIGIYINNHKNTVIKRIYIDDIMLSNNELGSTCLYQKEFNDIGICSYSDDKALNNMSDLNIPKDSNPVYIGFYNKDIKTDYIVSTSDELLDINGTLLRKANIPKSSIKVNINFNLHIITSSDEHYVCNINFDIPFEDNAGNSMYDSGYIIRTFTDLDNYKFLKISVD